ncbi:hypothetical protein M885DRAFT_549148 [Pelagophyceae sp. CCMP2097]|nr:hypothetical protein M885DRAFT_549148 [Pelagophyceae sp. CCMP2097]
MRTVDDSLAGGAKGKGAPAARRAVQGLEALVLDAGETLETDWVGPADFWPAQEGATEPADDALSADDSPLADAVPPSAATRTFPPRGGLSIALDFFLSPGALQPGGCAALVEAAAGNALTISLAGRPAAGAAGGGAVDDAADPDASAQTAPCAFVVVVEYRAGDDAPATFEFDAPAFSAGEWHSLAVSFSPFGGAWATRATLDGAALAGAPGERGAAVDGAAAVDSAAAVDAAAADAPCGCTLRVGGGTFAGGVSALRLGVEPCDAGADAPKLAATTACFRAFYAAEAEQAARDAADLAAWEAAWPLEEVAQPPPADAAAKNAAAAKDAAAAKGAAAKKPPQAGEPEAERARKPGAPPRPETMPRAARARRRLATLVGGAVDVAGLRLSARQPPGAYFLRVEDASREGHMRWSDAEQAVFPLLPHADAAFTVA